MCEARMLQKLLEKYNRSSPRLTGAGHTGAAGPRLLDHYYWSDSNVFKNCKVVCMEMWGLQRKGTLRPQRKLKEGLEFPLF